MYGIDDINNINDTTNRDIDGMKDLDKVTTTPKLDKHLRLNSSITRIVVIENKLACLILKIKGPVESSEPPSKNLLDKPETSETTLVDVLDHGVNRINDNIERVLKQLHTLENLLF